MPPTATAEGSLQRLAREALAARLRDRLGAPALHPGGEHALRFADALVPSLSADDVAWARGQLARRARAELRPARSGAVPAHAAWSSTALVCSAFAAWRAQPAALTIAGATGFAEVRLEERLHIPHGGGTPNLDVALAAPGVLVGVESKLTEHLAPRRVRAWPPAYRRPRMAAALTGGWARVFGALLDGSWAPRHLDVPQLVRHALSLQAPAASLDVRLVLLFWEPADGSGFAEVAAHRAELDELLERLGEDASPPLHALTHAELFAAWDAARPRHAAALRDRYDVSVGPR